MARNKSYETKDILIALAFLAPYGALWFFFLILPIGYGFYISLHKWNPVAGSKFIGLQNYTELFSNPRFWESLKNTLEYSAYVIPLILGLGLGFALLLHRSRVKGSTWIEAALFFPYLLNVSVISILWAFILDPDVGIVPYYLRRIGIPAPSFLNDSYWVIPAIAFATAWWLSGYRMIVFRAGLNAIPDELYESASLDGAGRIRSFLNITLPLMKPSLLFASILTLVGGLRAFGQVIIMTNGGPGTASEVLAIYMYHLAFEMFNFGQAAAVGFILLAIIFSISLGLVALFGLESDLR